MAKLQDNTRATILIVDDEPMVRDVVRQMLEHAGFCVLAADGAAQAIHLEGNTRGKIHLLLSDVVMPGIAGPVLAEFLGRRRPEMRVMLMSGHTDADTKLWKNDWIFLQKPFLPVELVKKVNEALNTREFSECSYTALTKLKASRAVA